MVHTYTRRLNTYTYKNKINKSKEKKGLHVPKNGLKLRIVLSLPLKQDYKSVSATAGFFLLAFWDRVSLYSPGWPGTHPNPFALTL